MKSCTHCLYNDHLPFTDMCKRCYQQRIGYNTCKLLLSSGNFAIESFDTLEQLLLYVLNVFLGINIETEEQMMEYVKNTLSEDNQQLSTTEIIEKIFSTNELLNNKGHNLSITLVAYSSSGKSQSDLIVDIISRDDNRNIQTDNATSSRLCHPELIQLPLIRRYTSHDYPRYIKTGFHDSPKTNKHGAIEAY